MQGSNGNERFVREHVVSGEEPTPVQEAHRDFGAPVLQQDEPMADIAFANGRTISMGSYQFARVQIGVRVVIPELAGVPFAVRQEKSSGIIDQLSRFVQEVLAREEALIRRIAREDQPLPMVPGVRRSVWVEYGLTLNAAAKFESHKIEIMLSRPLAEGEDAGLAMQEVEAYLAQRVNQERERVQGKA